MKKNYINFIKIIAILFVISVHLLSKAWNNMNPHTFNFKVLTFIDIIFLTCVPLFAMCSGAIFLNRNDSIKKILLKYTLKIYLIFIIFTIFYKIADVIMYQDVKLSYDLIKIIIKDTLMLKAIYHLWYLKIVIAMYLSIPIFKLLLKIKTKYIDHIILILVILFAKASPIIITSTSYLKFIAIAGFVMYFYLGYYLDKYSNKLLVPTTLITMVIAYIYTYHMTISASIKAGTPIVDHMQYLSYNIMFVSIFVFTLIHYFKNIFDKEKISNILNIMVKHNFIIYLIHALVIGALSYIKVIDIYNYNNPILIIIFTIVVYIICYLITDIYLKVKNLIFKKA